MAKTAGCAGEGGEGEIVNITNVHNLPEVFCESVDLFDSDYDRGDSDYTATELIRPVRINVLTKRHWNELTEDVSDRVWRLGGHVKHLIFKRLAEKHPERYIAERRMYANMETSDNNGGVGDPVVRVSGQLDLYDKQTAILWDYKESSVWKFVLGDTREWEEQANINAYCLRKSEWHVVHALQNLVILKDWKAREAQMKPDYPQCAVHIVDLPMWSDKECENFIGKRLDAIADGQENPPLCTPNERWERGEKWAVMKKGRKSAVKLYDDRQAAHNNSAKLGLSHYVEHRPAEPTRCLRYCGVAEFCDFGRQALGLLPLVNVQSA
jgi:hypothetical protein